MSVHQQALLLSGASNPVTYATWNPADKGTNIALSNGDLDAVTTAGTTWTQSNVRSTIGKTSGKWYWETKLQTVGSANFQMHGIGDNGTFTATNPGAWANSVGVQSGSSIFVTGVTRDYATAMPGFAVNDVLGFALDMDNKKLYLHRNGTYFNSGDPAGGTGSVISVITATTWYALCASHNPGNSIRANFGATAFAHSVPSGYNSGLYT